MVLKEASVEVDGSEDESVFLEYFGDSPYIKVLDFLLDGSEFDYSMTEVARGSGVGWSAFIGIWKHLLDKDIIVHTRNIGNAKLFKLNKDNLAVKKLIKLDWELTKIETDKVLEWFLKCLDRAKKYKVLSLLIKMKLYFVRHGESNYNTGLLINYDPKVDVHLTKKGIKQAKEVKEKFKDINFDVIFISEFQRTKQTAEIIKPGQEYKIDKLINEFRTGFEGRPHGEWKRVRDESDDPFRFKLPGLESYEDVKKRVEIFVDNLKGKEYENVLVVSHEIVVKMSKRILDEKNYDRKDKIGNADVLEFEI